MQNVALNTNNINSVTFDPEIHDFTSEFACWFFTEILKGTVPVLMHFNKKNFSFNSWVVYKRKFVVVFNYRTMIYPVIVIVHLPLWTICIHTLKFHSKHPILWYKCITSATKGLRGVVTGFCVRGCIWQVRGLGMCGSWSLAVYCHLNPCQFGLLFF